MEEWSRKPTARHVLESLSRVVSKTSGKTTLTELLNHIWNENPHISRDEVMTALLRLELWGYIRSERIGEEELEIELLRR